MRGGAQIVYGNLNWATSIQGVTPEYFTARDWQVVAGRTLTQEDVDGATKVAAARRNRHPQPLRGQRSRRAR